MLNSKMKVFYAAIIAAFALLPVSSALAGISSGGGGGFKSSSPSSSPKPSSSSGSSKVSSGSSSAPKPTASKPSSGSKPQTAPASKMLPALPPKIGGAGGTGALPKNSRLAPSGSNYARDRQTLNRNSRYSDPYNRDYFGSTGSPFFYLWLIAMMDDDDDNDPVPPSSDEQIDGSIASYLTLISAAQELAVTPAG